MANHTETITTALLEPLITAQDYFLWQLSFTKEGPQRFLRIMVDRKDGEPITMSEITALTDVINTALDEQPEDFIPGEYMLDICSPGIDRPLTTAWHFEWAFAREQTVQLALFKPVAGTKKWVGRLIAVTPDQITLTTDGAVTQEFQLAEIARAAVLAEWSSK